MIIVTHNMQQAARASDITGFLYMGELIEYGDTKTLFTNPKEKLTEDYISGNFGYINPLTLPSPPRGEGRVRGLIYHLFVRIKIGEGLWEERLLEKT